MEEINGVADRIFGNSVSQMRNGGSIPADVQETAPNVPTNAESLHQNFPSLEPFWSAVNRLGNTAPVLPEAGQAPTGTAESEQWRESAREFDVSSYHKKSSVDGNDKDGAQSVGVDGILSDCRFMCREIGFLGKIEFHVHSDGYGRGFAFTDR